MVIVRAWKFQSHAQVHDQLLSSRILSTERAGKCLYLRFPCRIASPVVDQRRCGCSSLSSAQRVFLVFIGFYFDRQAARCPPSLDRGRPVPWFNKTLSRLVATLGS